MALTHSTGFANFWWLEPDQKLRIHYDPGARFAYSGEGLILLQFAIEQGRKDKGLGVDVGDLTNGVFKNLGMMRTGLKWREDFRPNLADGFNDKGEVGEHDERSKVRAAGSMDTTIEDLSKFAAALVRGDGLSAASRAEMVRPQLHIGTKTQFHLLLTNCRQISNARICMPGLVLWCSMGRKGTAFSKEGMMDRPPIPLFVWRRLSAVC